MDFFEVVDVKTIIKFLVLFVPLAIYILFFTENTLKWKVLLTFGSFIGVVIALAGKTLGRDHGFGGNR